MIADALALALMVLIEGALLLFTEPVDVPAKWEAVSLLAAGIVALAVVVFVGLMENR